MSCQSITRRLFVCFEDSEADGRDCSLFHLRRLIVVVDNVVSGNTIKRNAIKVYSSWRVFMLMREGWSVGHIYTTRLQHMLGESDLFWVFKLAL